jgi:hypothetical protein
MSYQSICYPKILRNIYAIIFLSPHMRTHMHARTHARAHTHKSAHTEAHTHTRTHLVKNCVHNPSNRNTITSRVQWEKMVNLNILPIQLRQKIVH